MVPVGNIIRKVDLDSDAENFTLKTTDVDALNMYFHGIQHGSKNMDDDGRRVSQKRSRTGRIIKTVTHIFQ